MGPNNKDSNILVSILVPLFWETTIFRSSPPPTLKMTAPALTGLMAIHVVAVVGESY